jgi:rhodanese-related sulfurtransferase
MPDAFKITVEELRKRMEAGEEFVFLDVRNPEAWAESEAMVPNAIRVPLDRLEEKLPYIPKERNIVTYCT